MKQKKLEDSVRPQQAQPTMSRLFYPKKEAAYQLGISPRGLEYLLAAGRLKKSRIGGRVVIYFEELLRFATGNNEQAIVPVEGVR